MGSFFGGAREERREEREEEKDADNTERASSASSFSSSEQYISLARLLKLFSTFSSRLLLSSPHLVCRAGESESESEKGSTDIIGPYYREREGGGGFPFLIRLSPFLSPATPPPRGKKNLSSTAAYPAAHTHHHQNPISPPFSPHFAFGAGHPHTHPHTLQKCMYCSR